MMDVAVPANLHIGLKQDQDELRQWTLACDDALATLERGDTVLVDLRDKAERARYGQIPGSLHAPYSGLTDHLAAGGILQELSRATGKRLLFYCAFGERSAMAVQAAHEAGLLHACHIKGGLNAWKEAHGPLVH
jgi:rhodanese-related sulfurtransferase